MISKRANGYCRWWFTMRQERKLKRSMVMSIYKGIVQAHEIGIEIADILEKYGMNSEEGEMLMSEIKATFDNYNQTYVSFE